MHICRHIYLHMYYAGMACFTYSSVFALSGPPTVANLSIDRNSMQVSLAGIDKEKVQVSLVRLA